MNKAESKSLIPGLTDDISEEILAGFTVEELVRLSLVSKPWYDLVFSKRGSSFARFHLRHPARNPPRRVCLENYRRLERRPRKVCRDCNKIPDVDAKKFAKADLGDNDGNNSFCLGNRICVVSCIDGIFCLVKDCECNSDLKIYLWNPALRQSYLLPRSMEFGFLTLAVGFVYDTVSEDYLVAKIQAQKSPSDENLATFKVEIYSLKTHSWTRLVSNVGKPSKFTYTFPISETPLGFSNIARHGINCLIHNRYLYWKSGTNENSHVVICYVHMNRENDYGEFVVPDYVTVGGVWFWLKMHKGCLTLCSFNMQKNEFEFWEMIGDHSANSWVKKFGIPNSSCLRPITTMSTFTAGGKILGYLDDRDMEGPLVVFDPEVDDIVESVKNGASIYDKYFVVDNYVESLVSVVPASYVGD